VQNDICYLAAMLDPGWIDDRPFLGAGEAPEDDRPRDCRALGDTLAVPQSELSPATSRPLARLAGGKP
jgi:hypothetical protein